jgi:histidinol-phosphate phosphatase family protein
MIRQKMNTELEKLGAFFDREYYCLHHPESVVECYRLTCDCRKPKPGLLLKAAQEMDIDLQQSWFVGDNLSDVQTGKSVGCRTILIGTLKCELCNLMDERDVRPQAINSNLPEAVQHILKNP